MLLSWALLVIAFAPSIFPAKTSESPEGMVFCPLTHKFQPIKPPQEEEKEFKPFNEICTGSEKKELLFREFFIKNTLKQIPLDEHRLNDLAIDFLKHGKSVLRSLPSLPNSPSEHLIRRIGSFAVVSNTQQQQLIRKQTFHYQSPVLLARPTALLVLRTSTNNPVYQSAELSRRLAPRAPPLIS